MPGGRASRDVGAAFVFTGQGAQYVNMGIDLLRYPKFKAMLSEIDNVFKELGAEWSLFDELRDQGHIDSPEFSQPLCTAIQIALVELLENFNIFPNVVVGHSSGEIAAAYTVGALSLRSACKAAFHRGRVAGPESFLAKASPLGRVSVACINSSNNYPFDKSLTYWHESRISRDWRLQEEPSHSLLGLRTSDWNLLRPRWRKMLKVEEVPWIADHVVDNTIVFPAVGSIAMAVEAAKQTVGIDRAIMGYHIKEATFMSPIIITPGQATEVMTHLYPLQQQSEKSSNRFQIEIFSYTERYWRACNKCTIHVKYEQEAPTEIDGGQEDAFHIESMARKYENKKT